MIFNLFAYSHVQLTNERDTETIFHGTDILPFK